MNVIRDGVENMKISIFVPFFPPKRFGGFEIASDNLANYLTNAGHEVHVLTTLDIYCIFIMVMHIFCINVI